MPRFEKGLCIIIPVFEEREGPRGPELWICFKMTQTVPNAYTNTACCIALFIGSLVELVDNQQCHTRPNNSRGDGTHNLERHAQLANSHPNQLGRAMESRNGGSVPSASSTRFAQSLRAGCIC